MQKLNSLISLVNIFFFFSSKNKYDKNSNPEIQETQIERYLKECETNGFNGVSYYAFSWFPEESTLILFATNTSTRESSRIPYKLEKVLFDTNYIPKPISKNDISELLAFIKNYSEDIGDVLKINFEKTLNTPATLNRFSGIYMRERNNLVKQFILQNSIPNYFLMMEIYGIPWKMFILIRN